MAAVDPEMRLGDTSGDLASSVGAKPNQRKKLALHVSIMGALGMIVGMIGCLTLDTTWVNSGRNRRLFGNAWGLGALPLQRPWVSHPATHSSQKSLALASVGSSSVAREKPFAELAKLEEEAAVLKLGLVHLQSHIGRKRFLDKEENQHANAEFRVAWKLMAGFCCLVAMALAIVKRLSMVNGAEARSSAAEAMSPSLAHVRTATQRSSYLTPAPRPRHAAPVAREVAFNASIKATSPPFAVRSKGVDAFFADESALRIIMSAADSAKRLDSGESKDRQRWEISTGVQFPGMMAKTVSMMNVQIDTAAPQLNMLSGESRTVCEGGPAWARDFLTRISEIASTTSSNEVVVRDAPGGKVFVSTVNLRISLNVPSFMPMPVALFERLGSEAIQKLLDKDIPPSLPKLREAYLAFAV